MLSLLFCVLLLSLTSRPSPLSVLQVHQPLVAPPASKQAVAALPVLRVPAPAPAPAPSPGTTSDAGAEPSVEAKHAAATATVTSAASDAESPDVPMGDAQHVAGAASLSNGVKRENKARCMGRGSEGESGSSSKVCSSNSSKQQNGSGSSTAGGGGRLSVPEEWGAECSVCREAWQGGDEVQQMPCRHCFHVECLAPWLVSG